MFILHLLIISLYESVANHQKQHSIRIEVNYVWLDKIKIL